MEKKHSLNVKGYIIAKNDFVAEVTISALMSKIKPKFQ